MYAQKIAAIMPANMEVEVHYQDRRVLLVSTIPLAGMIQREGPAPPTLEGFAPKEESLGEIHLAQLFDRKNK